MDRQHQLALQVTAFADAVRLGGIGTLQVPSSTASGSDWDEQLYRDAAPELSPITVRAIPYPLWAHRGAGSMAVWLRCTMET